MGHHSSCRMHCCQNVEILSEPSCLPLWRPENRTKDFRKRRTGAAVKTAAVQKTTTAASRLVVDRFSESHIAARTIFTLSAPISPRTQKKATRSANWMTLTPALQNLLFPLPLRFPPRLISPLLLAPSSPHPPPPLLPAPLPTHPTPQEPICGNMF